MREDEKQLIRMKLGGSGIEESKERVDAVTFLSRAESTLALLEEIAECLKKVSGGLPEQEATVWAVYAETEIERGSLIGYLYCDRSGERFICEAVSDKCPRAIYEDLPLPVYCEHFSWDAFPANAGSDRSDAALRECVRNYINTESHEFQIQKRFKALSNEDVFRIVYHYSYDSRDAIRELGRAQGRKLLNTRYGIAIQAAEILLLTYIVIRIVVAGHFSLPAAIIMAVSQTALQTAAMMREKLTVKKQLDADPHAGVRTASCVLEEDKIEYRDEVRYIRARREDLREILDANHYYILLLRNGQYVPIKKSAIGTQDYELRDFRSWMHSIRSSET